MTSTQPKPKTLGGKPLAITTTGLAFIAILSGFAMSVMPLLSTAGKVAAVIAGAGFTVSLFASALHAWRGRTGDGESDEPIEQQQLQEAA